VYCIHTAEDIVKILFRPGSPYGRGDLYGDYADEFSLLASMLEILVLALETLHKESSQIGLEINWSKTKLQVFGNTSTPPTQFQGEPIQRGHKIHGLENFAIFD